MNAISKKELCTTQILCYAEQKSRISEWPWTFSCQNAQNMLEGTNNIGKYKVIYETTKWCMKISWRKCLVQTMSGSVNKNIHFSLY